MITACVGSDGAGSLRAAWYGAPAAVALAVAAGTTLLALVDPSEPGHYPLCPIRALTGLYCAGCGGLRAVHALAHGDVAAAVHLNALFVVSIPFLVAGYLWWVRARRQGRSGPATGGAVPSRRAYWLVGATFALMLAFGVLRNLPAFAGLAP